MCAPGTKAQRLILQPALQTKLPLAQIQLLPVWSEELAVVLGACELHACSVRRLFNLSLILALG